MNAYIKQACKVVECVQIISYSCYNICNEHDIYQNQSCDEHRNFARESFAYFLWL